MKIRLICRGEDHTFWVQAVLNNREVVGSSFPVKNVAEFEALDDKLMELINHIYERGVTDGQKSARLAMRDAMGF